MRVSNQLLKSTGFICIIVTLGLTGNASGQPQRRALPDSTQIAIIVDSLTAQLSLSDSVKSKVNEIYFASFANLRKERGKDGSDFRAMRNTRRAITEKREKQVKALLNDKQKIVFEKIIEEERSKMRGRMRGRQRQF